MKTTVLIVDAVAVLILLFSALRGQKRGLVRTLTGILALLLAFWGASVLAQQTSPYLSSKYVEPWIYDSILPTVTSEATSSPSESVVSDSLGGALSEIGLSDSIIDSFLNDFVINLSDSIERIVDSASRSIGYRLTYALLFLIYFLVLYLLLRLAAKLVQAIAKIPGINFVNRTFGLILGLVFGYLTILALSYILTSTGLFITPQLVSETYVLRFLVNFNPLAFLSF